MLTEARKSLVDDVMADEKPDVEETIIEPPSA
jgi:hypothetical protein